MGFGVISGMCAFGIIVYVFAHVLVRKFPMKNGVVNVEGYGA